MGLPLELAEQLRAIALLADDVAVTEGEQRVAALAELTQRAAAYAWIDENVVFPAFRLAGWKGVRSDLLLAASLFRRALADLMVQPADSPAFTHSLHAFRQAVAARAAADEVSLAPALQQSGVEADPLALHRVAQAFDLPSPAPPNERSRAEQLIEEASLVLGGLLLLRSPVPGDQPAPSTAATRASNSTGLVK